MSTIAATAAPPRRTRSQNRLPSLDGLRAISIAMVLLGHLAGTRGYFQHLDLGIGDYAHLGVVVFFVISGFLITRLLLTEFEKTGRVSLKLFYSRRCLRLFPAAYTYLAVVALLTAAGVIRLRHADLWFAATYTMDFHYGSEWVSHLWSLSVEEQFYLLWPFAFSRLGRRHSLWFIGAMIAAGPVSRAAMWYFLRGSNARDMYIFPVVADSLAYGCLLACLRERLESQQWYLRLFRPAASWALVALVFVINRYQPYTLVSTLGFSIENAALAILIHRSVYCSKDWLGRMLNARPLVAVGVLSYSLYLWQQFFVNRFSDAWVAAFPQNLLFAAATGLASYYLLEKPLLRLRQRLRREAEA